MQPEESYWPFISGAATIEKKINTVGGEGSTTFFSGNPTEKEKGTPMTDKEEIVVWVDSVIFSSWISNIVSKTMAAAESLVSHPSSIPWHIADMIQT